MAKLDDSRANYGINTKFLVQFPLESLLRTFAGFDLAAGKLPLEGHWLIWTALTNKDLVPANNQRRRNKPNLLVADGVIGMCSVGLHLSILAATSAKRIRLRNETRS